MRTNAQDTLSLLMDIRHRLRSMSLAKQEKYIQEEFNAKLILQLEPLHTYTEGELHKTDVLERALIQLVQARFGAAKPHLRTNHPTH